MATTTERFGFTLPAGSDPVLRAHINGNTNLTEQYIGATQDMIAPMYDDTATYDVGDICTYDSVLYKCITAITTAEPFDATKWTETTAVEEGSGGGGGSNVIPNPTGTPTDTLNTIGIDGTIYDIEGGGGSGAPYKEETLWSGSESTNAWASPVVLNIDIDAYDFIAVQIATGQHLVSTRQIPIGDTSGSANIAVNGYWDDNGDSLRGIWLNKNTNVLRIFTATGKSITVTKVVGIKLNGTYLAPVVYSTEECEIGVWIDGKPLYQKTFVSDITLQSNGWTETSLYIQNCDNIIKSEVARNYESGTGDNGYIIASVDINHTNGRIDLYNFRSVTLNITSITVWYTKTTDTAGSGKYTPAGLPTARGIEYDNTDSGLDAENAQDAIDELSEDILTLQNVQGYDAYDETQTYAVGDYAIYNNIVYECTTAVSTAEPFDSTKWSATSIEQIIEGVKGDITELNSSLEYKPVSNLFSVKSAYTSIIEITDQTSYRVGNIIYVSLTLHRLGTIANGEHDIIQCSIIPKIITVFDKFHDDYGLLIQTNGNGKFQLSNQNRAWYTLSGYILV